MLETRFHDSIDEISAASWQRLVGSDHPFTHHAFLAALEEHACISPELGWQPHHLGLYRDNRLVAAAPLYLKGNSRGEFVFDWGWADAFERAGGRYYPKLLNASPWSPVTGPRLLAGHDGDTTMLRRELVRAMVDECRKLGLSSIHANFLVPDDAAAFDDTWLARTDIQFHWHNHSYRDFDDFLAALTHKRRKNIRRERRQAREAGLECRVHEAHDLDEADWDAIHTLYQDTFRRKGNIGVLTPGFLKAVAGHPDIHMPVALARRGRDIIAMALFFRSHDTLYGRYWGSREAHPGLHFELCYHLGIDHAITHGLQHFEPGAQGEHKLLRGFVPEVTHSRHFIAHPAFHRAVAQALDKEREAVENYRQALMTHWPYTRRSPEASSA